MELRDLVGSWKNYYNGANSYTVTTYWFSADGIYRMHSETSMFFSSPLGSTSSSSVSDDRGFFIIKPDEIQFLSEKYGSLVKKANITGGMLILDYEEYFQ